MMMMMMCIAHHHTIHPTCQYQDERCLTCACRFYFCECAFVIDLVFLFYCSNFIFQFLRTNERMCTFFFGLQFFFCLQVLCSITPSPRRTAAVPAIIYKKFFNVTILSPITHRDRMVKMIDFVYGTYTHTAKHASYQKETPIYF